MLREMHERNLKDKNKEKIKKLLNIDSFGLHPKTKGFSVV